MSDIDVRIVRLEPLRVASSYGFGAGPEGIAWDKMIAFVKTKGLGTDNLEHRYLGFNNPSPSPGSPNYGYEQWITVGPEVDAEGEIKIKNFGGGLYAVTHCKLSHITEVWMQLIDWREKSRYRSANHQWLEECLTPPIDRPIEPEQMEFDLYLPIAE